MTIRRAPRPPERFTRVDNRTISDERLSFKAMGVLVYVLSKPDHWRTNRAHLATTHTDGEAAVGTALRELREAGYITDEIERDAAGRITGKAMVVHERPVCDQDSGDPDAREPTSEETAQMGGDPLVTTEGSNDGGEQTLPSPSATPAPEQPPLVDVPEPEPQPPKAAPDKVPGDRDRGFDQFWEAWPRRNGRRHGKAKALTTWRNLTLGQRYDAFVAARHYADACARGLAGAMDAVRFLRDPDYWRHARSNPDADDAGTYARPLEADRVRAGPPRPGQSADDRRGGMATDRTVEGVWTPPPPDQEGDRT